MLFFFIKNKAGTCFINNFTDIFLILYGQAKIVILFYVHTRLNVFALLHAAAIILFPMSSIRWLNIFNSTVSLLFGVHLSSSLSFKLDGMRNITNLLFQYIIIAIRVQNLCRLSQIGYYFDLSWCYAPGCVFYVSQGS